VNNIGFDSDITARLGASLAVLLIIVVGRYLLARWEGKRIQDPEMLFRARKATTYLATTLAVLLLVFIWLPFVDDLGTFLGLVSAGIAIALAPLVLNLAGWAYIVFRRPFAVGHRVEVGDEAGDVVDIRAFRFTILEIRNWVDADQSTGRVVHIPNGRVFTTPMANFTEGFAQIWNEISFVVTFESNWERAEQILREAMAPVAVPEDRARAAHEHVSTSRDYRINYRELRPTVYVNVVDQGVQLTGRLLVEARQRRTADDRIWRSVLSALAAAPDVAFAYPTTRFYSSEEPGTASSAGQPPE